ncbi:MAG: hypothetical protein ACM3TN_13175 [Alphaproteobacteria bacterium]
MATELTHPDIMAREYEATMGVVAGGSIAEATGGLGAIVLAILGLVGLLPQEMAAIAAMAVAVALLLESTAVATRLSDLLSDREKSLSDTAKLGGGMGAEFIGGVAGGVLGLLALLGITPLTLVAIAVIVFGASLLLSSGATYRLDLLASRVGQKKPTVARALVAMAASGVQVLIGIAAIALGIIALVGISTLILVLAGLLSVGAAVAISGSSVGGTIASVMEQ